VRSSAQVGGLLCVYGKIFHTQEGYMDNELKIELKELGVLVLLMWHQFVFAVLNNTVGRVTPPNSKVGMFLDELDYNAWCEYMDAQDILKKHS
jgi:hypothetical protein